MTGSAHQDDRSSSRRVVRRDLPDEALVEPVREGDEAAFEVLFKRYYSGLCGFVRSYVVSPEIAEDVVQEVLLRVWDRRASWRPDKGVRAYLFTACRNLSLDRLKHRKVVERTARDARDTDLVVGAGRGPERPDERLHALVLSEALHRAVHRLPVRRREVFVLRWQHGMSHQEIGQVLGISAKGSETQFYRAMKEIRRELEVYRP